MLCKVDAVVFMGLKYTKERNHHNASIVTQYLVVFIDQHRP